MAIDPGEGTRLADVREAHRFDEAALDAWLKDRLPDTEGRLRVRQFGYGQSNPTFAIAWPNADYVLRKKPPGELLPSAHAVDREYRVQKALADTPVPVARQYLYCDDESVIGTPFYVMERMEGRVYTDSALPGVEPEERSLMYRALAEVLAALHSVDPEAVGLGGFGRPGNYFERQFNRWARNYRETATREIPAMYRLMDWLPPRMPDGDETRVAHGDFRVGNVMFHASEPRIVAVFDWELATLGHPLSDLAYLCILFNTTSGEYWGVRDLDRRALGIPEQDEFVETYRRAVGRADGLTPVHSVHAMFRFASILDGVRARGLAGNAASDNAEEVGRLGLLMAERAWELAEASG